VTVTVVASTILFLRLDVNIAYG